ncbi:triphosphate tunel metalloenzyme 3-like [Hordeum vulgare]|nr:triphosphate tunel metalloenzyme 3-like [Hordeum vulgare]
MEVEVKLRLRDAAAHRRLYAYLAPRLVRTDAQLNAFFDAPAQPLAAATAVLRVRLYGPDDRAPSRAVLALKRRARIDAGVSRVEEVEEPLDPEAERLRLDDDSQARQYHRHRPCRPTAHQTEDKLTESIFVSGDDPLSMPTRGFIIIQSSCRGSVSGPELMETRYVAASAFDFNACDGQNGLLRNSAVPVEDSVVVLSSMVLTQPEVEGKEDLQHTSSDDNSDMMKHIHLEGDVVYKGYSFVENGVELWYVEVHLHHVKGVCPKTMGQYFFISRVPRATLFDAVREAAMEAIRQIGEILEARLRHTQEYLSEVRAEMMEMKLMATMMKPKMDDFKEHLGKIEWN